MATKEQIAELNKELDVLKFLSPNEPLTRYGVQRVLDEMSGLTSKLDDLTSGLSSGITLWNSHSSYDKGDLVVYFKEEDVQSSAEQGIREFVFILVSLETNNTNIPNYDIVDHIPDFTKSGWKLLNPLSYLLQNLNEMRNVVLNVFKTLLNEHVEEKHGLIGSEDVQNNLVRKDYSNLQTPWAIGKQSLTMSDSTTSRGRVCKSSNGIMEIYVNYGFDVAANQQEIGRILDSRYFLEKSPIWDESDQTVFTRKYIEDDLFSVKLGNGNSFNDLRYGTNIFMHNIEFGQENEFLNDEYCVFFDTYSPGQFVFGYDKQDLESKEEPTYDAIVSRPMLMNKTKKGFVVVLPIHTYFNSMQKYNIGVPWKNEFRMQVIGRYR